MFYTNTFYAALAIFGIGLAYKVSTWFRYGISEKAQTFSPPARLVKALRGTIAVLFSRKVFVLIKVFFYEGVVQVKILQQDFLRWLMHICIYWGFILLLLMHALEDFISEPLFSGYYATVNPYMFLRNFFGAMVILGIGIAIYRRFILKVPRLATNPMDHYAIFILAVIMMSGVLLEATKITSYNEFQLMVDEYTGLIQEDDAEEIAALESYWVEDFGVVSPNVSPPFGRDVMDMGIESHETYCMECHSRPQWAFLGFLTATLIKPFTLALDQANMPKILWYIHFLACWIGLAYLPFSKMFHIFVSPLSLMVNAVMDKDSDPANIATRQVMELDACTHCCTCTLSCSAAVFTEIFPNTNILPSEKLISIKALAAGKTLNRDQLKALQEGVYLCTNCRRCTVVCPVGINLQALWLNVRERLLKNGYPEKFALSPLSYYRGLMNENADGYKAPLEWARKAIADTCELMKETDAVIPLSDMDATFKTTLSRSDQASTFSHCFGCATCSTVCPVVAVYDTPKEALGLLPHQIMNACGLGLKDLALGSHMLWDCLTCYQCQEHCPQGVCVTDILYELKNKAVEQAKTLL